MLWKDEDSMSPWKSKTSFRGWLMGTTFAMIAIGGKIIGLRIYQIVLLITVPFVIGFVITAIKHRNK